MTISLPCDCGCRAWIDILTVEDVAFDLGISPAATRFRAASRGVGTHIGRTIVFTPAEVEALSRLLPVGRPLANPPAPR